MGEYRFEVLANGESIDYVIIKVVEEGTIGDQNDDQTDPITGQEVKLSSLVVKDSEGKTLDINFESEKTTYNIALTDEIEFITIEAEAQDSENVKIQGDGKKTLLAGKNVFEIIVEDKAQTTKKTYTINVNVKVLPVTYLEYNSEQLGLMKEMTNVSTPTGFKKTKTTINKQNVEVFTNSKVILVYAVDSSENGDFYIYREDDGIISQYNPLIIGENTIYLLDVPSNLQSRDDMTFETIQLAGKSVKAWVFDDTKLLDYVLIYGLNSEGEEGYMVCDTKNQEIHEYPDSEPTTFEEFEKWLNTSEKDKPNYVLYGSIGAVVLAVIGVVIWMVIKNKKEEDEEDFEDIPEGTKEFNFDKKVPIKPEPKVNKVVEEEKEDDEWLTDQFYKTIMGDDDE